MMNVRDEVAALRKLSGKKRGAYLQHLIGKPSDDPFVLDERARFVTLLRKEGLWPLYGRELTEGQVQ